MAICYRDGIPVPPLHPVKRLSRTARTDGRCIRCFLSVCHSARLSSFETRPQPTQSRHNSDIERCFIYTTSCLALWHGSLGARDCSNHSFTLFQGYSRRVRSSTFCFPSTSACDSHSHNSIIHPSIIPPGIFNASRFIPLRRCTGYSSAYLPWKASAKSSDPIAPALFRYVYSGKTFYWLANGFAV